MNSPNQITQDFVVLSPEKAAFIERNDESLYSRIDDTYKSFVGHELISCHEFESDWSSWEIHPKGDEVVMLISGEITFVMQQQAGEDRIPLKNQGEYLIVPKGTWHTAKVHKRAKVLFITPGEGTAHRADLEES